MWQGPFSLSTLIPLTESNWFDPQWGYYLANSTTLVLRTLEISKHPTFHQCLISKILEPPNESSKQLNYNSIRWNLSKNNGFSTPWFLHLYIKKWLWHNFSNVLQSRIYINVEINKLHCLKQFDTTNTFFLLFLILLKDNRWFDHPWGCFLTNSATLVFTTFEISKDPTFPQCRI